MDTDIRFKNNYSDVTSSDEEYDENEKRLLKQYKNGKHEGSESEMEVLGVRSDDREEESDKSEIALSDVEDQGTDDIPDSRAWGKEKKKYYGTDYIDPDYGGFEGKDAQAAEIEEEEARNIQNQLVQQLDDNDFTLDVIFKKKYKKEIKEESEEVVKTDYSQLTNKQKISILQKESPEFFGLIEDFKGLPYLTIQGDGCNAMLYLMFLDKMEVAKDYLKPVMDKIKRESVKMSEPVKFIETYYSLILNYATNISMYLLLKSNKELNNHPVIKTLYQYRQLLSKMEPIFEEFIKPQIILMLKETLDAKVKKPTEVKKLLKILSKEKDIENKIKGRDNKQQIQKINNDENKNKRVRFDLTQSDNKSNWLDINKEENQDTMEIVKIQSEELAKRAITYQIAKNKGLTPNRKKEYRNPRVKHKLKFRKALIRRKGAVREPRKELKRYAGEISGIKASLSKSIKIKS